MIDWLRRATIAPRADPVIELASATLPVEIRRHARARRMTMRLAPDGQAVRITLPRWGRTEDALSFAGSRRDWIEAQLEKHEPRRTIGPGDSISFRGHPITLYWAASNRRNPVLADDRLVCGGPPDHLAARAQRWLERQALALMTDDLAFYCDRAGLARPELRLARAQRRWGSCSSKGTVRINWRLVQAPDNVRRSVVAHEVAHLVHFDHSPRFHVLLAELFGEGLAEADDWLHRKGRTLYAAFG
jgi:hypothetical protein